MLRGLLHHAYLVATFRHDGHGMPKELSTILFIYGLYILTGLMRHGFDFETLAELSIIGIMMVALLDIPLNSMVMFISIITNLVAFMSNAIFNTPMHYFVWTFFQMAMDIGFMFRYISMRIKKF